MNNVLFEKQIAVFVLVLVAVIVFGSGVKDKMNLSSFSGMLMMIEFLRHILYWITKHTM